MHFRYLKEVEELKDRFKDHNGKLRPDYPEPPEGKDVGYEYYD